MSLRASCSTHLMSAFDKSANSKARGLEKVASSAGGWGGEETSVLVLCGFNWEPYTPFKQNHLKLIRLKKYIWL